MNKSLVLIITFISLIVGAIACTVAFLQFHTEDKKNSMELQQQMDKMSNSLTSKEETSASFIRTQIRAVAQSEGNTKIISFQKDYLKARSQYDSLNNEYQNAVEETEEIKRQLKYKTDSLKHVISSLEDILAKKDSVIAQKDSIIAFLQGELVRVRLKSAEAMKLLQKAIEAEKDADGMIGFWNRNDRKIKYAEARLIYQSLWKQYDVLAAEESFHRTWKKLDDLGVHLNE
jgi:uncharacterized protein (DUF3084 family)